MKKLLAAILLATLNTQLMAQPAKSRVNTTANKATTTTAAKAGTTAAKTITSDAATQAIDRASLMFPTKAAMPEDVTWRRDIYRQLDLKEGANAALYYPIEPMAGQMNLFTCLFRLVLNGRLNAYSYKLDGNESFADKDKINLQEFLKDQSIYYEMQNGKITVADADIPSRLVLRYYLKESTYLDQRTGTTHTKVTALCPILLEGYDDAPVFADDEDDEFAISSDYAMSSVTPRPLFWVKYDDVAPYLAKLPIMISDRNNVTNMTAADYFSMNRYEGKIYKTNNMQGQTLKDYCRTDSAITKEQARIEQELKDFEEHLWGHDIAKKQAEADSVALVSADNSKTKAKTTEKAKKETETNNRRTAAQKSSASSAPRVSTRRERR